MNMTTQPTNLDYWKGTVDSTLKQVTNDMSNIRADFKGDMHEVRADIKEIKNSLNTIADSTAQDDGKKAIRLLSWIVGIVTSVLIALIIGTIHKII
jgi:Skp family chaperone for outer membrane proteins